MRPCKICDQPIHGDSETPDPEICWHCWQEEQHNGMTDFAAPYEPDYGGAFDGFDVTSDADPGL